MKKKSLLIPMLIMVIAAAVMIGNFFLPYFTATDATNDQLSAYAGSLVSEETGLVAEDFREISLYEMGDVAQMIDDDIADFYSMLTICMLGLPALTLLFAALRLPIFTILFDLLSCGLFSLYSLGLSAENGILKVYDLGIGAYAFWIAAVLVLAGSIWMIVLKHNNKKRR